MDKFIYVFLGGGFGSILRYSISLGLFNPENKWPWATFSANLAASFLLGILVGYLDKNLLSSNITFLLVIGFCGGFSTFSTFSLETLHMYESGNIFAALSYIALSVIFGVLMVFIGLRLII